MAKGPKTSPNFYKSFVPRNYTERDRKIILDVAEMRSYIHRVSLVLEQLKRADKQPGVLKSSVKNLETMRKRLKAALVPQARRMTMQQYFKRIGEPNHPLPPGGMRYTEAEWREMVAPTVSK
jgi:hypothetical protein